MFSRSRIGVIKPRKRVNAPTPWVYVAPADLPDKKDADKATKETEDGKVKEEQDPKE